MDKPDESLEEKVTCEGLGKKNLLNVVCFNCGETGHYSSGCRKPKVCFICHQTSHVVDKCLEWKKYQVATQYYGSPCSGLGFFHIDVEPRVNRFRHWLGMDNFGLFSIVRGEMDEEEILENLRYLFGREWNWQLKKQEGDSYIVRFPPTKKVKSLVVGSASLFYLNKLGVMASLKAWNRDIEPIIILSKVWVQVRGIPPKWVDWWTIKDIASTIGLLEVVDWPTLFTSLFSVVRIRIKCKNPSKIPHERVYELGGG